MSIERNAETGITSVMGFVLPCRLCEEKFITDLTGQPFAESITGKKLTPYWAADAADGDKPIGYSEGTGDSFECKWCHAFAWSQLPEVIAAKAAKSANA